MKKATIKSLNKRREERKDFPEFYKKHVAIILQTKACCMECGIRLKGDVSEVAHILNKGTYKSVATNDKNIIYLCGWMQNNCHDRFDSGKQKEMKIYDAVKDIFHSIAHEVKEKINQKIWDKWET